MADHRNGGTHAIARQQATIMRHIVRGDTLMLAYHMEDAKDAERHSLAAEGVEVHLLHAAPGHILGDAVGEDGGLAPLPSPIRYGAMGCPSHTGRRFGAKPGHGKSK